MRSFLTIKSDVGLSQITDRKNFKWRCGNGSSVLFWEDIWLDEVPLMDRFSSLYAQSALKHTVVKDWLSCFNSSTSSNTLWINPLNLVDRDSLDVLTQMLNEVTLSTRKECITLIPSAGPFSTAKAKKVLLQSSLGTNQNTSKWAIIWGLKIPPKFSIFLWKIVWGILPTNHFLHCRIQNVDPHCIWCGEANETVVHVLWECEVAVWAWQWIQGWWSIKKDSLTKFGFNLTYLLKLYKPKFLDKFGK